MPAWQTYLAAWGFAFQFISFTNWHTTIHLGQQAERVRGHQQQKKHCRDIIKMQETKVHGKEESNQQEVRQQHPAVRATSICSI